MIDHRRDSSEVRPDEDSMVALRRLMVEQQLRQRRINDERVLSAMGRVPREAFLPMDQWSSAYDDSALPIAHGQTISQPFTVAFMIAALELSGSEKVLEIGTGSGYGAAVLSLLAREVHSVERIPELAHEARERLQRLAFHNVIVHVSDGSTGLPGEAPFDAIVVTAGSPELPAPYVEQLASGGRIVIPVGRSMTSQKMTRYWRIGDGLKVEDLGLFAFVPLVGQFGWPQV